MNQLASIVQRYHDAFNRRDFALYERLFTPDCVIECPGIQLIGIEGARDFDRVWLTALEDGQIVNLHKVASANVVMCENRYRGRHTGPLTTPDLVLPPSGRQFDEKYTAVFELEGERIKRQTLYFDRVSIVKALGPVDATATTL